MHELIVTLPDIGEGVVEGEVIEWLKAPGDQVEQDEAVVIVMTDKATVELPAPRPGTIAKHFYQKGEVAIKDEPLYSLTCEGEGEKRESKKEERQKALATPATRRLAKELSVDIQQVQGSGSEKRVTDSDVVLFHAQGKSQTSSSRAAPPITASTPPMHLPDDEEQPVTGLRHVIAEKMVESKYIIPHFSYFDQLDATRLVQLRQNMKPEAKKENLSLTYMPFFIKALSVALEAFPRANSSFDLEHRSILIHKHHNVGVATRTSEGLVVVVIKNVQDLSLQEVIRSYDALMKKSVEGTLDREEMTGSTITLSNFGPLGGLWATPIINYPESTILGIAKIAPQPVARRQQVVIRDMLNLSWSFDHRIIDGEGAASLSNAFIEILTNPARLL